MRSRGLRSRAVGWAAEDRDVQEHILVLVLCTEHKTSSVIHVLMVLRNRECKFQCHLFLHIGQNERWILSMGSTESSNDRFIALWTLTRINQKTDLSAVWVHSEVPKYQIDRTGIRITEYFIKFQQTTFQILKRHSAAASCLFCLLNYP